MIRERVGDGGLSMEIFDPEDKFILQWNKTFLLCSVIALSLDPLFFYIPVIDGTQKCLSVDRKLEIFVCVVRSFADILYVVHIIVQFRTGYIAHPHHILGLRKVITEPSFVAKRYLKSYFFIDILAALPLPQFAVLVIIPNVDGPASLVTKDLLKFIIFSQYVPRLIRVSLFYQKVTKLSGFLTDTAWAGAAFNFFLYVLASHVIGALWYLFALERELGCWNLACGKHNCHSKYLYCGEARLGDFSFLNTSCPLLERSESTNFDFGIFLDALQTHVVETRDFRKKFLYCSWWGLQSLSSLGQNLKASTSYSEILFADFIAIIGLVLFSLLISNMQKYLQSFSNLTLRVEEMKQKRREAEELMSIISLPEELRQRVRRYKQYRWKMTRGVELDSFVGGLPRDLRTDIKRHLCLFSLKRVPMFEAMDEQLLDAMCLRLKPFLYTEKSYVVREGDPVNEMLFVTRGKLQSVTTAGGRTGFFNSTYLKAGDFCGEELLTWALDPKALNYLPWSTRTVQAITDVEAFALMADDLKFVASQFRRLHSKHVQHTFRFYSQQWRTWAACYIQAAWRKYCRRKQEAALRLEEKRLLDALAIGSQSSISLGATIYASRFANIASRTLKQRRMHNAKLLIPELPPMLLQKPAEHRFSANDHRFYSQQRRTWAACFIQVAWRRHCRRKNEAALRQEEKRLQNALAMRSQTSSISLGAALYATRFASRTLKQRRMRNAKALMPKLPPILLQKPGEPDSSDDDPM